MKIGFVIDTTLDSDAGVQQYVKGLARYFISKKHDVKFIAPPSEKEEEFRERIISFGRQIVLKGNANTVPTLLNFGSRKIKEILKREKFDILHVATPFSPFLGALVINQAQCPVVSTYMVYGMNELYRLGVSFLRILLAKSFNKIDLFIAPSEIAKEEAEKTLRKKHIIITHAVDIRSYSPDVKPLSKFSDSYLNIFFLGRFEKRKGVLHLIKAFNKVKKEVKNARLILAGDGPLRSEAESLVKNLGLKDVCFEGYIKEKDKAKYYASADICVFPATHGECFGLVLIESMASGKVTIAFANEGYRFVLRNIPELLVENRNIEELAEKIKMYSKDEKLRRKYADRCRKEALTYSWKSVGRKIEKIYEDLLRKRKV